MVSFCRVLDHAAVHLDVIASLSRVVASPRDVGRLP